jgi:hypothetical protein
VADTRCHTNSAARIAREIAAELREHGERWWPGFRAGKRGAVAECLGWHIQEHGGDAETLRVFGFDSVEAVMAWNDRADVTIEDVIALCDDVAALSDETDLKERT